MAEGRILADAETLEEAVFQALGAASTCWEHVEDAGVFDSTRAKAIGDELMARIRVESARPCPDGAALNIRGEHYPCDMMSAVEGHPDTHEGWSHGNRAAGAIWQ